MQYLMICFFFIPLLWIGVWSEVFAQCPLCTIDLTCDSVPAAPKLCPASLPTDTAGQYYSADITFYIPKQFNDPQYGTVNLNQIEVLGVTGLPPGMTWTAYNYLGVATNSFYPPASPPSSERGCAKICGTPPLPFDDSITVSAVAYVTVSGVNASQNVSFKVYLKIIPNPSGNSVFTMSNSQGCNSVTVNFTPNLQSNGNPLYTYDWNFGNGNTSTAENVSQTYTTPGTYTVKCTTKVFHYVITAVNITALNANWCGDVEEFFCFSNNPDVFFQVNSNGGITTSDTIWNIKTPSWSNLNFPIEGSSFIIYFFDADNGPPTGSPTDSLGYQTIAVSGNGGTYNFNTPSPFSGTQGSVTVGKLVKDTYIDSDKVYVYAPPAIQSFTYSPNDTVCAGDSVKLSVDTGYSYQWYNDSVLIFGATNAVYYAKQSGNYKVKVTSVNGCTSSSSATTVFISPNPMVSVFANGTTTVCEGETVTLTGSAANSYLWSNGATTQSINVSTAGNYALTLTVTNANGCSESSSVINVTVNPKPIASIAANGATTFCQGDSVVLTVTPAVVGSTYLWSHGTTMQSSTIKSSGVYTVTVTDTNGCSGFAAPVAVTVKSFPEPAITANGSTTICMGDSVQLTSAAASAYLWSNGATSQSVYALSGGNYGLTVTYSNGCKASVPQGGTTVTVNNKPTAPSISQSGSALVCSVPGMTNYQWLLNGNVLPACSSDTCFCLQDGAYSVVITNFNGCSAGSAGYTAVCITSAADGRLPDFDSTVGIAEVDLYPNPNTGIFHLSFSVFQEMEIFTEVFNVLGERIYFAKTNVKQSHSGGKNESGSHRINLGKINPGVYFVKVTGGGKIFYKKIVIE